ncbi:hypothetical protein GCM10010182_40120 [Actinomadura cremea]|nr:hypothetical protein GCM10010182_40120 [Actinomadura cremea]
MTNPSDPGQPARPPAGGQPPGGPYGPPPPPHPQQHPGTGPIPIPNPRPPAAPPGRQHGQGPQNPNQTGPGPYGSGPQVPPQGWVPPERTEKGALGALFDANFDSLVTPKLIKLFYIVSMLLISLQCLVFLGVGLWIAGWDSGYGWGIIMIVASPLVWLFEMLIVRIFMEAVVVRFKSTEYLRIIKDKS